MTEPIVVRGPVVESTGTIMYEITLASGMIVTDPSAFGPPTRPESELVPNVPVVTPDGRVLVRPRTLSSSRGFPG